MAFPESSSEIFAEDMCRGQIGSVLHVALQRNGEEGYLGITMYDIFMASRINWEFLFTKREGRRGRISNRGLDSRDQAQRIRGSLI